MATRAAVYFIDVKFPLALIYPSPSPSLSFTAVNAESSFISDHGQFRHSSMRLATFLNESLYGNDMMGKKSLIISYK